MSDKSSVSTGPGTTSDPNQADLTNSTTAKETPPSRVEPDPTPDDPKTGPGTTSDPNQADRN